MKIYRDPGPRLVSYLVARLQNHQSERLPAGLSVTGYVPLGKPWPRLIVGYSDSDQINDCKAEFATTLEWSYEPTEPNRTDDDSFRAYDDIETHLEAFNDLVLEFLEDAEALHAAKQIVLEKQGVTTSNPELEQGGQVAFVTTLTIQSYYDHQAN